MNRPILMCALILVATASLGAQEASQASQSSPYEGVSTPPADDTTVTAPAPHVKPRAGKPVAPAAAPQPAQTQVPARTQVAAQPQPAANPAVNSSDPDGGVVAVEPAAPAPPQPALTARSNAPDPDGDIVHPQPPGPGELPEGATIRVELLDRLSTVSSEKDEAFRSRVASDVLQGGQVLIPAGTEIDGRVAAVSSGHPGGHGSMRLRPETMILPDGTRYQLHADLSGTPGAKSKVGSEGDVLPASRLKRDGIEYGGAVGAGAATGAIVGGPVGAVTGSLIGAGVVTAHLLISHPQATLESGTVLVFTLSEPLQLALAGASGN
ncbi:MAG: hypothetical protein ABSD44_01850 [Terracidiphilus sp.]